MEIRNTISGCITAGIWGVLVLVFALIPADMQQTEPQFKEIAIQLEPMQAKQEPKKEEIPQKSVQETPAPVPESVPEPVPEPAPVPVPVAKVESVTKPEPAKKAEPVKKAEPAPSPAPAPAPQKLQKSVEELMAEQQAKKPAKTSDNVDWDAMFGDSSSTTSTSAAETTRTVSGTSGVAGTAATAATADTGRTTTSAKAVTDTADAALGNRLASVSKTWSAPVADSGMTAAVSVSAVSSGTGVSVVLEDGTARKLIMPSSISPDITGYASLIDGQPEVAIRFEISPEGTVSYSSISVSAGLPPQVVEAIKQYLSSELWFEQSSSIGIATFTYRISRQ